MRGVTDPITFAKIYLLAHVAIGAIGLGLVFRLFDQEYTPAHALAFALVNFNGNGIYEAVFGGIPLLRSQNITSRLVLLSILLFATSRCYYPFCCSPPPWP